LRELEEKRKVDFPVLVIVGKQFTKHTWPYR